MTEAVTLADDRLNILESIFSNNCQVDKNIQNNISQRVKNLDDMFATIVGTKIPMFLEIFESLSKIGIFVTSTLHNDISASGASACFLNVDKMLNEILLSRTHLETSISCLETIRKYQPILNRTIEFIPETASNEMGVEEMLIRVEVGLYKFSKDVEKQTHEIDRILNIYENLIIKMSEYLTHMDWKLRLIETQQ